ncbi:elongation of very long chain fatty acids protein 4 [Drosophila sechellia]|uniref:Elongation of very long chain fatty acids protein n=1 Tax=Drosophila sechellia TaxID=7238 RepID=B4HDV9_DROSE|nr:elongation of very long chain fatty acids protein 4 [Drosophila sechellia]EDW41049.1 GM24776 [Drosophila sechellia]
MTTSVGNDTKTKSYSYPFADLADERTQNWPLVKSPWNIIALLAIYLLMVRYAPKWTARFKPLQLRVPLFCHSLSMIFLNGYICLEFLTASLSLGYNFACQQCRMSHDPHEIRIAAALWWFYISKILEFADTAFFILRHKWNQLSFLHVYHHSTMFLFCWIYVKWLPTGSIFFPSMINSFVHVIMYSYYALSVLGPRFQKFLWWKRYLTGLQLVQFTIILFWASQLVFRGCEYGKWLTPIGAAYMVPFLFMFGRFYAQKYNVSVIKKAK